MKKARLALVEALKRSMLPEPEPDMRDWNWQRFLNWQTHKHGLGALIDGSYRGRRSPQEIATEERTNREAKAEEECGQWILSLKERPQNKDIAFAGAAAAVARVGRLSRKAFERQWAINARPEWKRGGRRRR